MLGSDISLIIWLWVYIVFVSFDCLIKAILCMAGLTGFGFHFCVDKCNCSSLFTVLYIGLCRVGLSKSFCVLFIRLVFVGECLARIVVILVKTAKLIQSPRPAHVAGGWRVCVDGHESNRLTQVGVLGPISINS